MKDQGSQKPRKVDIGISRRTFLKRAGGVVVLIGVAGCDPGERLESLVMLEDGKSGIPVSEGYLLVDTKKCQGCMSCMLACSLVHDGEENLSLARIQIIQNPFGKFPDDLTLEQCRQCVDPACLEACREEALTFDVEHGNVRRIDAEKCIGCMQCVEACPYDAIYIDPETHSAAKCHYCSHRTELGLEPACVTKCITKCLHFGEPSLKSQSRRERHARYVADFD